MARTRMWSAALGVAVLAAGLGGCANKDAEMTQQLGDENAKLREERDALAAQVKESDAKAAQMAAERERLAAEARQPKGDWTNDTVRGYQPPAPPMTREAIKLEMAGDVAFSPGQATLTSAGKKELDGIIRKLNGAYAGNSIRIEGYTDSDPIKKAKQFASNEALSQARAEAVMNYMASKGVSTSRMEAIGRGSADPKSTKAASRRVEIHILA